MDKIDRLKQYRIGVLAGGPSSEREISLLSGEAVFNALKDLGLDIYFFDLKDKNLGFLKDNEIEIAFIALHGGFGENGEVQGMLDDLNLKYTGSGAEASRKALDKILTHESLEKAGIKTPEYVIYDEDDDKWEILGYPCVIKPQFEGSSMGISVLRSEKGFKEAIDKAKVFDGKIIIEKYIPGRELTVGILKDAELPVVEIMAEKGEYDYSSKYQSKTTEYLIPANLDKKVYENVQYAARRAHDALGCRSFSRVDIRYDGKDIYVLEVNTIPGLTERSLLPKAAKAYGLTFSELCLEMLWGALTQ